MGEEGSEILGIIVGGGPAPGLNLVLESAVSYASRLHWKVIGFHDGYRHMITGDMKEVDENTEVLIPERLQQIMYQGGSYLRPDRIDPTKSVKHVHNVLQVLKHYKIKYFLPIGGNDKIMTTHKLIEGVDPFEMKVICIPKTIDNDIILPDRQSTFGFHTAHVFGSRLVRNLMADASSAPRWFIVETMGRASGHLAMAIGEAAGAHAIVIPEDFGDRQIELDDIADIIQTAILKRYARGKTYGVCVISEGLVNKLTAEAKKSLFPGGVVSLNEHGKIILDDAEISHALRNILQDRVKNLPIRVCSKQIGYELRSRTPVSFDCVYSRELGYGAIEGFRDNHSNCCVVWQNGAISYMSFRSMMDPITGKIKNRKVNTKSEDYKILREYTWQLKRIDLTEENVTLVAKAAKMSNQEFRDKFSYIPDLLGEPVEGM